MPAVRVIVCILVFIVVLIFAVVPMAFQEGSLDFASSGSSDIFHFEEWRHYDCVFSLALNLQHFSFPSFHFTRIKSHASTDIFALVVVQNQLI